MERALQGLRILDLSMNLPGPYLTWLLACLGASVVKLENPDGGDYARALAGAQGPGSPYFASVNRHKLSLALNLKHPQGRLAFLRLLESHDVLVEGFRPGTMERLGLGHETLRQTQPRLIQVSISGYGQDGPYRQRAGHDVNYLALAGALSMTGSPTGQLALPGVQIADLAGGSLLALGGLLAAVIQRQRSGQGQLVDVSMHDGSLSLATMVFAGVAAGLEEPRPGGMLLNGRYPCYGLYSTADGRWMSLGALEPKFWGNFCAAVQRPDLLESQFAGPPATAQVAEIFAGRSQAQWVELMAGHDCCCEPVLDLSQAAHGPLAQARGMLVQDQEGRPQLACPLRLAASPPLPEAPAPGLGQHSAQVLKEAGFSPAEIGELAASGAVGLGPGYGQGE